MSRLKPRNSDEIDSVILPRPIKEITAADAYLARKLEFPQ